MLMERAVSTEDGYIRPSVAVFRNMSPTYADNNRGKVVQFRTVWIIGVTYIQPRIPVLSTTKFQISVSGIFGSRL